jgi:hypothetical protein
VMTKFESNRRKNFFEVLFVLCKRFERMFLLFGIFSFNKIMMSVPVNVFSIIPSFYYAFFQ